MEVGNFPRYDKLRRTFVSQLTLPIPSLGLDDLSHRLQEEGSYGYGVIFLLIWVTTFRKCRMSRATTFVFMIKSQRHCHCTPPSSPSLATLTGRGRERSSPTLLHFLEPSAFTHSAGHVSGRRLLAGYREQRRSRGLFVRSRSDRSFCLWFALHRTRITS